MKKLALAAAVSAVAATASFAGNPEPMMTMEPTPVVETASSSSGGGLLVPLIILGLVALVVANNN